MEKIQINHQYRCMLIGLKIKITFKIKDGYTLELLTSETMKLLGSNENKITKDKNGENVLHLKITDYSSKITAV